MFCSEAFYNGYKNLIQMLNKFFQVFRIFFPDLYRQGVLIEECSKFAESEYYCYLFHWKV
jgi:hypothetical protein